MTPARARYESNAPLNVVRCFFVVAATSIGWSIARTTTGESDWFAIQNLAGLALGLALGLATIAIEARAPRGFYPSVFAIVFGLLVGFVSANFFLEGLNLLPHYTELGGRAINVIRTVTTIFLCYLTVSLFLKAKDEFAFLLPFVRLTQQEHARRPKVVDTSAIVDGRIAELCRTNLVEGPLLVPRFVLERLQAIAESPDKQTKTRGRRGLDILQRLQALPSLHVQFDEEDFPAIEAVEQKTIELARRRGALILTSDYDLKSLAELQGIRTVNLNEVALAMKIRVLPGDSARLHLLREGENPGQAVGYLEDGTLVVVESARSRIGEEVEIAVTSVIQKPQGNLVFGKIKG